MTSFGLEYKVEVWTMKESHRDTWYVQIVKDTEKEAQSLSDYHDQVKSLDHFTILPHANYTAIEWAQFFNTIPRLVCTECGNTYLDPNADKDILQEVYKCGDCKKNNN